jgi:DNA-binding PucR family transcriptional regulator
MDDQLEAILPALAAAATPDGVCSVGVSRAGSDLRGALREALACARFAGLAGRDQAIVMADDLGAMRFLLRLEDPAPLADYINEQLGDFLEDGNARESQLIETLRAFLELDGHQGKIAERCHIHKSTVKYRLARIAELTGRSLNDPETKFELRLAFAMADVLTLLELAPRLEKAALLGARLDLGRDDSAAN